MSSGTEGGVLAHIPLVGRRGGFGLVSVALGLALLLLVLTAAGVEADGRAKDFVGSGLGTSQIVNPEECDSTGRCRVELEGEFDAGEMGSGTVRFIFTTTGLG